MVRESGPRDLKFECSQHDDPDGDKQIYGMTVERQLRQGPDAEKTRLGNDCCHDFFRPIVGFSSVRWAAKTPARSFTMLCHPSEYRQYLPFSISPKTLGMRVMLESGRCARCSRWTIFLLISLSARSASGKSER